MAFDPYAIRVKRRSYVKIAMILGSICVCGTVTTAFIIPFIIKSAIAWNAKITPGSMTRNLFLNVPFPLEFHCHVFHIENPDEVQKGGKPALKDIGPYVFHEYIVKHDEVDDEENDTLEYTLKKTWIFKPELSHGLTGEEQITILHPVINSLALTVNFNRRGFLKMISDVIKMMFQPTTPFWTGRAMDLLFNGVEIDCTSNQFKVKSVCAIFRSGENAAVQPMPKKRDFFMFSVLGAYNDSFNGRFKVLRGKNDPRQVGQVVEVDGRKQMKTWLSDEENEYRGTDGYFMPPFRSKKEPLWGFERMICCSLGLEYSGKTLLRAYPTPKFSKSLVDFSKNKAYCRRNGSCPIEGSIDLFNCMGVPIIATLPHFLDTHPSLLENVKSGLEPKRKDHELFAVIDLETGVPFLGVKRLQFNFDVVPVPEVEVMKDLRPMIFPFAWIEEKAKLPGLLVTGMHCFFFFRLFVKIVKYLCLTLIPLAAIASIATHVLIQYGQIQVIDTPISSVKVVSKSADKLKSGQMTAQDIGIPTPKKFVD